VTKHLSSLWRSRRIESANFERGAG
jgi:hypothetical protein